MEHLNYEKALYCYEEVLILDPENINNMMRIGELYYTIGNGVENLNLARKYFSFILSVDEKNYRASWNLKQVTTVLIAQKKDLGVNQKLHDFALWNIEQIKRGV